jgi:sugar phosphate isomerase/epimerase
MPLAAFPKCFLEEMVVAKTISVPQWIDMAADELDIDGLEFYWGFAPREPDSINRVRSYAAARRLSIPMMCYSPDFTKPDASERAEEIANAKQAVETTAALGGKYCRVLSGQRRPEISRQDGIRMAAECIASLLPHAEKHGVTLILENHYKDSFWEYPEFAQKREVFLELLAAIPSSPWFGVNYDPSNAIIAGEDPIALLQDVKERVVTMHASDRYFEGGTFEDLKKVDADPQKGYATILKHGVIGLGMNDYDQIFTILKSAGFKGWISIEDGQDPAHGMEHLRLSADFLRVKMAEHGLE